jgi:RNA polymerase sigma-70 factor (ECF subfamily)
MVTVRGVPPQIDGRVWLGDYELVGRVLAGDEPAFEELVAKYGKRVLGIAARFFRQPEVREDIVQEVFIKIFQSVGSFRRNEPFEPWLTRITVNTCYDHLRQMHRRKELTFSHITNQEAEWLNRQYSLHAVEVFEREEQRRVAAELAEKILATLSPEEQMALLLYERDGLSTAEIANVMGWSRTNVKVKLFRARRALRKTLDQILGASRHAQERKS